MANITLSALRWRRLVPDLGDNTTLPKPFFLEVASGITNQRLQRFQQDVKELRGAPEDNEETARRMADALEGVVRLGTEPMLVKETPEAAEQKVETLEAYLRVTLKISNRYNWAELVGAVNAFNSVAGGMELFLERLSGGTFFTPDQNADKAAPQMGGR